MYKIRCEKNAEKLIKSFITAAGIDCEITVSDSYDVCFMQKTDIKLLEKLDPDSVIIANADDFSLLRSLEDVGNTIITCGLSGVSTITVSSIEDDACVICLQREIKTLGERRIYPQEIPVKVTGIEPDRFIMLFALGLVCEADDNKIKNIKLC